MDDRTPAPLTGAADIAAEGDRIAEQLATTTAEAAGGTVSKADGEDEDGDDSYPFFEIEFEPETSPN